MSLRHAAAVAVLLLAAAACSGDEPADEVDPAERLAAAKRTLDEAASIDVALSTDRLPEGVDGVVAAEGVGTHAPAFEGTLEVRAAGFSGTTEVVAVDDDVYVQLPFTGGFVNVDPADYGAPDPATLMDTETGLSSVLTDARNLAEEGQTRSGDTVLTEISGIVPGRTMSAIFPTADPDRTFDGTFTLTGSDQLDTATLTGPFYGDAADVTYDVTLTASDDPVEITAP